MSVMRYLLAVLSRLLACVRLLSRPSFFSFHTT